MNINITNFFKNIEGFNVQDTIDGISSSMSKVATLGEQDIGEEGEKSCDSVIGFLESPYLKNAVGEIVKATYNANSGMEDDACFKEQVKQKKPKIIKDVDELEFETNKLKKGVYSKIVGLDIRIDYLKNLIKNEENNQNSENGYNSDSNKTLNYDEKHDINKRLAIFYNKNLDILNIIYKILYYIYLSLFVIYFALCIFNFYMYKYKEEDEYFDKFKFTLIGTLLITFIPMLLKHILNKYMFF